MKIVKRIAILLWLVILGIAGFVETSFGANGQVFDSVYTGYDSGDWARSYYDRHFLPISAYDGGETLSAHDDLIKLGGGPKFFVFAKFLAADTAAADKIVFWAGRDGANRAAAEQFAAANGQLTLAQTTKGAALDASLDYANMTTEQISAAWTDISRDAAARQSGLVTSFGGGAGLQTIGKSVELPTLLRNPNVNKIIILDAEQPWRTVIKYPR